LAKILVEDDIMHPRCWC